MSSSIRNPLREQLLRLLEPPAPLSAGEKRFVFWATLLIAATRLWAVSATLWDWDEAQFALGVIDFDVARHHPHPPGFPLYIAAAKLANIVIGDPFRSLQAINLLAASLLFPVALFFARELRFPPRVAIAGALILVLMPTVWLFGGTAFSDISSLTLSLASSALLLRGCRDRSSFFAGALLLAVAAGVRPQNLMIGLLPAIVATVARVRQQKLDTLIAAFIAFAILASAYGAAAWLTGGERYRQAIASHREYIERVDSWRSPDRPPATELVDTFLLRPYRTGSFDYLLSSLAFLGLLAGIVRRRLPQFLLLGTFAPFVVFALFMLDPMSFARFAIAYLPMLALLMVEGVSILASWSSRARPVRYFAAAIAVISFYLAAMAIPAIQVVRSTPSPPQAAADWIRAHLDPERVTLHVSQSLQPHAFLLLGEFEQVVVTGAEDEPSADGERWLLTDQPPGRQQEVHFSRERGRLWKVVRHFYFDAYVVPLE
jgi:hypothetical protein